MFFIQRFLASVAPRAAQFSRPYQRERLPPPPLERSSLGRASFTVSALPSISFPFNALIARCASASLVISTKPNPLDRPVSRSVIRLTVSTAPWLSKRERIVL